MSRRIHLRDGKEYTTVSDEDFERASMHKWRLYSDKYVRGKVNGRITTLHHFVLGKPEKGFVVDHKDGNKSNNERSNLRFATYSLNCQNADKRRGNEFFGVYKHESGKYEARHAGAYLGVYTTAQEAAEAYDACVFRKYGEDAKTNGTLTYAAAMERALPSRQERSLPANIYSHHGLYLVRIKYKGKKYESPILPTLDDAVEKLALYKREIEEEKRAEDEIRRGTPIRRDSNGSAIITTFDKKQIHVDDDKYYNLTKYSWSVDNHGYAQARVDGKLPKSEGGSFPDNKQLRDARRLGDEVIAKLPPQFTVGKTALPRLLTRVDVGCCVNRKMFCSEVEYVPSLFINSVKKLKIDAELAEQADVKDLQTQMTSDLTQNNSSTTDGVTNALGDFVNILGGGSTTNKNYKTDVQNFVQKNFTTDVCNEIVSNLTSSNILNISAIGLAYNEVDGVEMTIESKAMVSALTSDSASAKALDDFKNKVAQTNTEQVKGVADMVDSVTGMVKGIFSSWMGIIAFICVVGLVGFWIFTKFLSDNPEVLDDVREAAKSRGVT
ncbi:hypothetical protein KFL_007940090 [Klebsormidium nitens]|uniref:AP2/ERF domain-containing protein n=1 Tax=Klebsormidium nitens TaxID=105231 RepID=A0A1Y1IN08_KLENI|nr:hypothetical protein KFL_007940090 [Klebsormidium nitens]|eukprot:GAQ91492.1 hypothetical protein KFL_007940090 [Klebsormidium nitens]